MKVDVISDNKLSVLISKEYTKEFNLYDKEKLELYFRDLFAKLRGKYELDIYGYYDITIYRDPNYGAIILFDKDDNDYFSSYSKQIDMCIKIDPNDYFVYKIDNLGDIDIKVIDKIYKYKNKLYIKIKDNLDTYQIGKMIEHTSIIYGNIVKDIIKYGKVILYQGSFI